MAAGSTGKAPAPDSVLLNGDLADTGRSGDARLRELEKVVRTARAIRDEARRSLALSPVGNAPAARRLETAERILAKAQREIERLRRATRLRRQAARRAQAAAPAPTAPAVEADDDFQISVLLGSTLTRPGDRTRPRTEPELALDPDHDLPVPRHPAARAQPHPAPALRRRLRPFHILMAFMGILAGALLAWALLARPWQSPMAPQAAGRVVPEGTGLSSAGPVRGAVPPPPPAPTAAPSPMRRARAKPEEPGVTRPAATETAWAQRVQAREKAVLRYAEREFNAKLRLLGPEFAPVAPATADRH